MEETDGFEKLYQNLVNSVWEDVSLERLVSNYRRCQYALVRILAQSHKGTQGRHKKHITYIVNFIKTEALPFIHGGTPHLIAAEDWEIVDIELYSKANIEQIERWQKKRLTSSAAIDTELKQQSILEWLVSRASPNRCQPQRGRPTASAPWKYVNKARNILIEWTIELVE